MERGEFLWGTAVVEPQVPVLGWEDALTSFDYLRRGIEDISYENCSGIALNLQAL